MTQSVVYNEWYGWISNDKWQRKKGEYYFSDWIDVRNDWKAFQLYWVDKTTLSNPNGNRVLSVLSVPSGWPDLMGCENGYLIDITGDVYDTGITEDITDIAIYGDYGYLVHWSWVSRWNINVSAGDLWLGTNGSNIDVDFYTFAGEWCQRIQAPDDSADYAYLYGGKDIYRFDDVTGSQSLAVLRSFKAWDNVYKITRVWSNYNIYMWQSKLIVPGSITDDSSNQKRIDYKGYKIIDAINDGNADFLIVEDEGLNRTSLLYSSGYENQALYTTRWWEKTPYDNERIVFDNKQNKINKLAKQWNLIYISGGDNGRVYSFWKQYNELSSSLAVDYTSNYNISSVWQIEDGIVLWTDNNIEIIKLVDPNEIQSYNGYLETNPFIGKQMSNRKRLKNLRIWYNIPDTSGSYEIKLYINTDESGYELLDTIDSVDWPWQETYTISKEFHILQFKVELSKTNWPSPQIFDISFTYDNIQDGLR